MKLLKKSTYEAMHNRIEVLECNFDDRRILSFELSKKNEALTFYLENSDKSLKETIASKNQMAEIISKLELEVLSLKPKAEKWDTELQRQALKSKIARIKKMSAKQLATKYLGFSIKYHDDVPAIICGYSDNIIICACNHPKHYWTEKVKASTDVFLQKHERYCYYSINKVKSQIINSLK